MLNMCIMSQLQVNTLQSSYETLQIVWSDRATLYDECLDALRWLYDAQQLQVWMNERNNIINSNDWRHADNVCCFLR
jgi:hypothetical protein